MDLDVYEMKLKSRLLELLDWKTLLQPSIMNVGSGRNMIDDIEHWQNETSSELKCYK